MQPSEPQDLLTSATQYPNKTVETQSFHGAPVPIGRSRKWVWYLMAFAAIGTIASAGVLALIAAHN